MVIRRAGLLVAAFLGIGVFTCYKHAWRPPAESASSPATGASRVAILSPMDGPVVDEIVNGFQETLISDGRQAFEFKLYNAQGTRSLMRSQVEDIIAQETFSLILAVGTLATQMATEITTAKDKQIPIVFCAIKDPVELGVVASEEHTGNHVTGITGGEWQIVEQLDLLCRFVPTLKKVIIPFDPSAMAGALAGMKERVQALLEEKGVAVEGVEIFNTNELPEKMAGRIEPGDVVLTLRDATVTAGIESLVRLCDRSGGILYASDLESVKKGATIGYAASERDTGISAAKKALLILDDYKRPCDIPVSVPNYQYKFLVQEGRINDVKEFVDSGALFFVQQGGTQKTLTA